MNLINEWPRCPSCGCHLTMVASSLPEFDRVQWSCTPCVYLRVETYDRVSGGFPRV